MIADKPEKRFSRQNLNVFRVQSWTIKVLRVFLSSTCVSLFKSFQSKVVPQSEKRWWPGQIERKKQLDIKWYGHVCAMIFLLKLSLFSAPKSSQQDEPTISVKATAEKLFWVRQSVNPFGKRATKLSEQKHWCQNKHTHTHTFTCTLTSMMETFRRQTHKPRKRLKKGLKIYGCYRWQGKLMISFFSPSKWSASSSSERNMRGRIPRIHKQNTEEARVRNEKEGETVSVRCPARFYRDSSHSTSLHTNTCIHACVLTFLYNSVWTSGRLPR